MTAGKTLTLILAGAACAALICVIAGLCIYLPACLNMPLSSAPDYTALVNDRARKMFLGFIMLIVGSSGVVISFISLLASIIIRRVSNKDKNNQTE